MAKSDPYRPTTSFALLIILNVGVWGWSVQNGFVFDDLANVLGNPWIKDWTLLPRAFLQHVAGFDADYTTSFYRPLMHVFYAIAYALAGARPWAFHLLNVSLHVLAVLSAYVFVGAVVARWGAPSRQRGLPLLAAIVFSLHPVHTEPILWIAGITDLSYTVFGLLALVCYMHAFRDARYSIAAGVLVLTSLLCKETGVVIFAFVVLLEWIEVRAVPSRGIRPALVRAAPTLAAVATYTVLRLTALGSFAPSAAQHPRGGVELAATGLALFARYMGTLVAPVDLTVMRSIHFETGIHQPLAMAGVLVAAALASTAFLFRRSAIVVLGIALVVLPVLPVLYVPAIESGSSVFGERYLYLPVLGIGLVLALALAEARGRYAWGRTAVGVFVALFVAWGGAAAWARTRAWSDSLSLWTDAVRKAPDNAAAHEGLCFALYDARRIREALESCARALALDSGRVDARINHATALLALGRAREAKAEFDLALAVRPNAAEALVNRGLACMLLGQPDEAMSSYRRALEIAPNYAEGHNVMGVALARAGRRGEALAHLEHAVRLAPENPEYRENLRFLRGANPQE